MAEYDNTNKMAGWLKEKDGKKYISISANVDGIEISGALYKNNIEPGSKQPLYSGPIGVKTEKRAKPVAEGADESDVPF
jgi:hypothetical protein